MKNLGIYVHFPFCASKCLYCDFNSYAGQEKYERDYLARLLKEIQHYSSDVEDYIVDTLYIGGGTPSHMFAGAIKTTILELKKIFKFSKDIEISIECNPNSVTYEKALEWKDSGVNRVSIGLQSASNNVLRGIGRIHTKSDYENAIEVIKKVGITNINTDIMIGLPSARQKDVEYTIKIAHRLGSTHISAYTLILEENTKLYDLVHSGKITLPKEERVISHFAFVDKYLHELGYHRYEVSNYAMEGYECKHNLNTWHMCEYVGFGAGAHSYFSGCRYSNEKDICKYMRLIDARSDAIVDKDVETIESLYEEYIMLGLRTTKGISTSYIKNNYNIDILSTKKEVLDKYLGLDYISIDGDYISATSSGMYVLNQIILDLV